MFFFFFKQKTAYEMRISDWSSDVCSSDLPETGARYSCPTHRLQRPRARSVRSDPSIPLRCLRGTGGAVEGVADRGGHPDRTATSVHAGDGQIERSEEHTSELQSLMRNSYAVFCLQKKQVITG